MQDQDRLKREREYREEEKTSVRRKSLGIRENYCEEISIVDSNYQG